MKLFFDMEFTGLHQLTSPISLGIISETGLTFYAEFADYDRDQINDWLEQHVIKNLMFNNEPFSKFQQYDDNTKCYGSAPFIKENLLLWLSQFKSIEFWGDCLAYDWVLLNGIISDCSDGYPKLPENVYYIPFDICTMMKLKGVDPDISREEYTETKGAKHNALTDAIVIKKCFNKLEAI